MANNNIITFPIKNKKLVKKKPEYTLEQIDKNVEMMRQYHIHETVMSLTPIIFTQLSISGFNISDTVPEDLKDGAFVVEALRAMMCRYYGIYHPLQDVAQNIFVADPNDPSALSIVDKISLEFNKT